MLKKSTFVVVLILCTLGISAQNPPFNLALEPLDIPELGGLQSYAFGLDGDKWLLVGGRLDGLHRRQPWASFDLAGHNDQLIVVDPLSLQKWSAPLTSLPISIQEQLSSTNMNFYQDGDFLYCIGGYGYSATRGDHTTFPNLTLIKIPEVIDAIIKQSGFSSFIRQIEDDQFRVTGGRLRKIDEVFHLLGGQEFLGRYNPMNHATFEQSYTNQIRRFTLEDDGLNIVVHHLEPFTDENLLHRRDYNAESQILPNGEEGITMFSGVFQAAVDLPYLNSVTVDGENYRVDDNFQQFYNHYHCATVPLYSEIHNEMHTVFFGGIAQYYDNSGILVQDNNVPFVKTIARVTRQGDGKMAEYKLPVEMPAFLGAGSEFIPNKNLPHYKNDVLKLDEINEDSTLIGYIYGGINSSEANIFWINNGTQSSANSQIFKVYLTASVLSTHDLNENSKGTLQMRLFPNPNNGNFTLNYYLKENTELKLRIFDFNGNLIEQKVMENQSAGKYNYIFNVEKAAFPGTYLIEIETPYERTKQKLILN
jgi:hypothetical protein